MSGFLERMARASRDRAAALRAPPAAPARPRVPLALGTFDVLAEIKPRSPALGPLAPAEADLVGRAQAYAAAGAAAISVLTEPTAFGGSLEVLTAIADALDGATPVMRKDFIVDVRQVDEARAAGASGVLLIAALTDEATLEALLQRAAERELFVLLECFDERDLASAARLLEREAHAARAAAGELLVGVNARDLRTLAIDPGRLQALAARLPQGAVAVAESGIATPDDARVAAAAGYRAALVGTALMQARDPAELVRGLLGAGRERVS